MGNFCCACPVRDRMAGFFCGLSGGRIVLLTTDIQRQPHFPEQKYNGSTSVTDEGESNSGVGNGIGNDGNIQNNLNRQMPHDSGSDHGTGKFLTVHGDDTESPEQQGKNKNQDDGTCQSHFFAYN